jgi:hypothetical protein
MITFPRRQLIGLTLGMSVWLLGGCPLVLDCAGDTACAEDISKGQDCLPTCDGVDAGGCPTGTVCTTATACCEGSGCSAREITVCCPPTGC